MNQLQEISVDEVEKNIHDYVLIDVRREEEWDHTGIIQGALKLTFFDSFGNCDVLSWMKEFEKHVSSKNQGFVLICAHANRTQTIGNYLMEHGHYTNVFHLSGGMAQWLAQGKKTI